MIVVDTNVIGYLYLEGERSNLAEATLARDPTWAAPLLWRSELRNVLATYVRHERLTLDDVNAIMSAALDHMHGREYLVGSLPVLSLAAESGCSAYDCEFVALALDLGVPLVTVDTQVLKRFPDTSVALDDFAERPA